MPAAKNFPSGLNVADCAIEPASSTEEVLTSFAVLEPQPVRIKAKLNNTNKLRLNLGSIVCSLAGSFVAYDLVHLDSGLTSEQ